MIIGAITIGCILFLFIVFFLKVWNLSNLGQKYSWGWSIILWSFCFIALGGLIVGVTVNVKNYSIDSDYLPDIFESSLYLDVGWVLLGLNTLLTIIEVMLLLGIIVLERARGQQSKKKRRLYA